ncbi:MAG: replication restart helicase PriA [Christensenellales bacterium]|jgi:primosomal protein N' (replication factor Y)
MIAEVIVDISNSEVDRIFDYLAAYDIRPGCRVLVPFGRKQIEGIVIALKETSEHLDKLKPIIRRLEDYEAVSAEMLELMWYLKGKFNLRLNDILKLFIPAIRGGRAKQLKRLYAELNPSINPDEMISMLRSNARKQADLIDRLRSGGEFASIIQADYGAYTLKALNEKGFILLSEQTVNRIPYKDIEVNKNSHKLNEQQEDAVKSIIEGVYNKFLLFGVTGSGKTEVYMNIIERTVSGGRTAILLVPEISLTPHMLKNLRGRFGESVAILHSGLSDGERHDEWLRLKRGEARIVVGARSAIFAPLNNIGVIIMDEEHEQSYISESNPRYDTKVVAKWRADYHLAKLILGSATPSIDTYTAALDGKYQLIEMQSRVNDIKMPEIEIIDMCAELRAGNRGVFSVALSDALYECIDNGNQAMIFINRRGYASFVMCRKCGNVIKCNDCDVSLTYHKEDNRLKCHYCGKQYEMLTNCPVCDDSNIRYGRVGTEQVVKELKKMFPDIGVIRMDNDTTRTKNAYYDILDEFSKKKASILVGTQMIAKGHDFPEVTVVGILDADMSLYFSDYLSAERTFQLVTQVAGRAGRSLKAGKVYLQTYAPAHYIFNFAKRYDYKGFYEKEANIRKVTNFPPFTKIIRALITARDEIDALNLTKAVYLPVKELSKEYESEFIYLQAMHCPVKRIKNKYRFQVMIRIKRDKEDEIINRIYNITDSIRSNKATVFVETNPQNIN